MFSLPLKTEKNIWETSIFLSAKASNLVYLIILLYNKELDMYIVTW